MNAIAGGCQIKLKQNLCKKVTCSMNTYCVYSFLKNEIGNCRCHSLVGVNKLLHLKLSRNHTDFFKKNKQTLTTSI